MNKLEKLLVNKAVTGISAPKRKRGWLRWLLRIAAVFVLLGTGAVLFWMKAAIYHRLVTFPREEAAWRAIRAQRQAVPDLPGWTEFRGILHSHSHLSHDSEVPFEEILRVLQTNQLDFICLSDHCAEGRADFSAQWRGLQDGKLFIPGFEMRQGFMPFGVAPGVVLSNSTDSATLAHQIVSNGGLLFYAHPEEERDWERPELTGFEIYNIHVDFKRSRLKLSGLLPEVFLNLKKYPDHVVYTIVRRPTEFLKHWDELNRTRRLTAIAGNDCHQNAGVRAFCTERGTLRIEDTSPRTLAEWKLNWLTRPLVRLFLGPLEPGRKLFQFQLDRYDRMTRLVNTHVLAKELTETGVLDALKAGRVFIGFDMIADSAGFQFLAEDAHEQALMGESIQYSAAVKLTALSPLPCRLTLLRDGEIVLQQTGRALEMQPNAPGKYRVEAELEVRGKWVPWVYANPIELKSTSDAGRS